MSTTVPIFRGLSFEYTDARIVHTDPKKAAEFIDSVDLSDWWYSEAVQSARDEFVWYLQRKLTISNFAYFLKGFANGAKSANRI